MKHFTKSFGGTLALVVAVGVGVAGAHVLTAKTDEQKLRKGVAKGTAKYADCLIKAAQKCEDKGLDSGVECHLDTGAVDYTDPKQPAAFVASVGKCDGKHDPDKKSDDPAGDYVLIGCPGDCDAGSDGTQPCADLGEFEMLLEGTASGALKDLLSNLLQPAIDSACAIDNASSTNSSDPAMIACVETNADILKRYAKGVAKCFEQCENDYKGSKGDGGPNNDPNCIVDDGSADPIFQACADSALSKSQKKASLSPTNAGIVLPILKDALSDASNGLYNLFDATVGPTGNPCGDCGDNLREGTEQCDGTDDAACPGSCNTDCTCP